VSVGLSQEDAQLQTKWTERITDL